MLVDFEAFIIDLPLELDTFEIHPDEFLRSGIFLPSSSSLSPLKEFPFNEHFAMCQAPSVHLLSHLSLKQS